jgi:uncharacterized protein (TIGR02646 family)
MVEIGHILPEPPSLAAHRVANPGGSWDDFPTVPEKRDLKEQLFLEQEGLCIYCEAELSIDDGHIEHIKSKGLNPPLTFIYNNLAHSCNATNHCGHFKKRKVIPIEPRPAANNDFALSSITGELSPLIAIPATAAENVDEAIFMLGLNNDPGLKRRRQQFAVTVQALATPGEIAVFLSTAPFRWSLRRI